MDRYKVRLDSDPAKTTFRVGKFTSQLTLVVRGLITHMQKNSTYIIKCVVIAFSFRKYACPKIHAFTFNLTKVLFTSLDLLLETSRVLILFMTSCRLPHPTQRANIFFNYNSPKNTCGPSPFPRTASYFFADFQRRKRRALIIRK